MRKIHRSSANDESLVSFADFTIFRVLKKSEKIRGAFLNPQLNDNNLSHTISLFLITISCKIEKRADIFHEKPSNIIFVVFASNRIAKSQQYDAEGLVDIFRQYGDHLYSKGDHNGAIEQYIKTIGKLEPSYVIRKFLDSQHIDNLTTYLQALHKQGQASGDHTTLLLNCYTKLNHTEKLKEFIMTKDREVDFDVDIAIKVCRQASPEDALLLARKHRKHEWYLRIQIEDKAEYKSALEYINTLDFDEAESNMKKYGNVLIENVPNEATQFLKTLCTNYRATNRPLIDQARIFSFLSR